MYVRQQRNLFQQLVKLPQQRWGMYHRLLKLRQLAGNAQTYVAVFGCCCCASEVTYAAELAAAAAADSAETLSVASSAALQYAAATKLVKHAEAPAESAAAASGDSSSWSSRCSSSSCSILQHQLLEWLQVQLKCFISDGMCFSAVAETA